MDEHGHRTLVVKTVSCVVVTVSDTRTLSTDKSGPLICERLESAGHHVMGYEIIPDEPIQVRDRVMALCREPTCRVVLLNGGTGISQRDTTIEAVTSLFEKHLPGFGELFRMLGFQQIGPAAMLSRATAGVCCSTLIFSMPGSPAAVRLAMDKLIVPEIGHLSYLLQPS